jgi:anti-sigma-K factor RskA
VEDDLIHALAAGYALNALDADEEREFAAHLATCASCRRDVASFNETAAGLGYAAPSATPPPDLRERILTAAGAGRENVVTLRPRWAFPALAAAAVATCAAVGLGVWAGILHSRLGSSTGVEALSLRGATGSVVLTRSGEGTLVVSGLQPAPAGKTYEVWVIRGRSATPAGLFRGAAATVRLTHRVPHGAEVGVTLERAGGSLHPSGAPIVVSAIA